MSCRTREGITLEDTVRHAGQLVPPFYRTKEDTIVSNEIYVQLRMVIFECKRMPHRRVLCTRFVEWQARIAGLTRTHNMQQLRRIKSENL
jgi:hypothetical protein